MSAPDKLTVMVRYPGLGIVTIHETWTDESFRVTELNMAKVAEWFSKNPN